MLAKALIAVGLFALGALATAPEVRAQVQPHWVMPAQDRGDSRQQIMSVREVAGMLRARFGGELLNARLERGPRPFYVIRWRMPNNDVRDFRVDAVSGQIR